MFSLKAQDISKFIHVDQFGYLPDMEKVAVLSNPKIGFNSHLTYQAPSDIEIRDAKNDRIIMTVKPKKWQGGQTHDQSGDQGWWVDFSSLTEEGDYYIIDTKRNQRSAVFSINKNVYNRVMRAAGRMFYYNRCNSPKEEPYAEGWADRDNFSQDRRARFVFDQSNVNKEKDLSGGWFDAGDYNKYVTFASRAIHDLLSAYEENPKAFSDNWNIPESGNGIPDIIDEIKWELDWLKKMNNPDGSTIIKIGSIKNSRGEVENKKSPPSANNDLRYYGPTCTSASIAIASMFSHASKVLSKFNSLKPYANDLRRRAVVSYDYVTSKVINNRLETNCDDQTIRAGDADRTVERQKEEYLIASIYLYEATSSNKYNKYIKENVPKLKTIKGGSWDSYKRDLHDALILYSQLSNADQEISSSILETLRKKVIFNGEGYFGFNKRDLYRAFQPNRSYHWGSNNPKAGYATVNQQVINSKIFSSDNSKFENYISEVIHYFHGVNPLGLVYLSNMYSYEAERSVNQIVHTWFADGTDYDHALDSKYGPPPGFVTGGANKDFTLPRFTPPYGQPAQKSYLDYNDKYPNQAYEVSEPAIYYQTSYIRMLANRVTVEEDDQKNNITIRAIGKSGKERMSLLVDNKVLKTWSVSKNWKNYVFNGTLPNGEIKVRFDNDINESDLRVDYVKFDSTIVQSESRAINTGAWDKKTKSCGESFSEWLHCEGYISFGNPINNSNRSKLIIKAKGDTGEELLAVLVNNKLKKDISLSNEFNFYEVSGIKTSDGLKLALKNDNGPRNVLIDYIINDNVLIQAESRNVNTGSWNSNLNKCGVPNSEWLHCNGFIDFGNSRERSEQSFESGNNSPFLETESKVLFTLFPNPSDGKRLILEINKKIVDPINVSIFDVLGKKIIDFKMETKFHDGNKLDISNYFKGLDSSQYFLKIQYGKNSQTLPLVINN
ncbi:hypothetical protein GCM10009430_32750 [Aquimarina litoralis]|uniref:Por secretion system C-terminal sorting domain-containing protein n=2 Tax=Aquimarina litoralis TaxID=584605 RepID=A0ABN1J1R8_9FLAO